MSEIKLYFLGTASAFPTPERGVSCIGFKYQHANWIFDCGEGSQIQLQKCNFKHGRISKIFITHLHGDHAFGLPGLMCTLGLTCADNSKHIDLYGPSGLRLFIRTALTLSQSFLGYTYSVHELHNSCQEVTHSASNFPLHANERTGRDIIANEDNCFVVCKENSLSVTAFEIQHRLTCFGYHISEDNIPGRLNVEYLRSKGLHPGPQYGILKRGEPIELGNGEIIKPDDALERERPGRKIVILGDTCETGEAVTKFWMGADLLVHEATYENAMMDKALENGHSTAGMAGLLAEKMKVKKLVLTHFSQRYRPSTFSSDKQDETTVSKLVVEAKQEFKGEVVAAEDLMIVDVPLCGHTETL